MYVSVGISNHHVHLKKSDYQILFGNVPLEKEKDLRQIGQFASNQFVTIKTEKREIKNVRVLGPFRTYTQVEISKTDARFLGIDPPVRSSGDLKESASVTLVGPKGELMISACILADRHIHLTKEHRISYGLENVEEVSILIQNQKGGILNHVHLKEAPNSYFEIHLDTDDANAFLLKNGDLVEILK